MPASARPASALGQTSAAENGTRKFGLDARARLGEALSLTGSAWHEDYLGSDARRIAARGLIEYRGRDFSRARRPHLRRRPARRRPQRPLDHPPARRDQAASSTTGSSSTPRPSCRSAAGREHRLPGPPPARGPLRRDQRRQPDRQPTRSPTARQIDARTARIGFDLAPWAGARIARQRQPPEHRRIWPAQLRRLRPVAVAGARRALVGRLHARRQPDARRDRPGAGAQSAPSGGERRLRRRRPAR